MISDEMMDAFSLYKWTGNIRELKNFIESSMNMMDRDDHVISLEHMPAHVDEFLQIKTKNNYIDNSIEFTDLKTFLNQKEKQIISDFLKINKYNVAKTARNLGISRQNLQYKMKLHQL